MSFSSSTVSMMINLAAVLLFVSLTMKHSSEIRKLHNNLAPYAIPCFFFAGFRECHILIVKTFSIAATIVNQSNELVLYIKASILFLVCLSLCWPVIRRLQHRSRPSILDTSETSVTPVEEKSPVTQPTPVTSTEEIVKKMPPAPVPRPTRVSRPIPPRRRENLTLQSQRQRPQPSESSSSSDEEKIEPVRRRAGHTKLRRMYLQRQIEEYNAEKQQLEQEQRSSPTDQPTVDSKVEAGVSEPTLDATSPVESLHSQEPITKVDHPSNTTTEKSVAVILPADRQAALGESEADSDDVNVRDAASVATVEHIPAASSSSLLSTQSEDVPQEVEEQDIASSINQHLVEVTSAPTQAEEETPAPESDHSSSSGSAKFADPPVTNDSEVEATIEQAPISPSPIPIEPVQQPSYEPIDVLPTFNANQANAVVTEFAANTIVEQHGPVSFPASLSENQVAQELDFNIISGEQSVIAPLQYQREFEQQHSPVRQEGVAYLPDLMDVDHYIPSYETPVDALPMEMDIDHNDRSIKIVEQIQPAEPTLHSDSIMTDPDDHEIEMTDVELEDSIMVDSGDTSDPYPAAAAIAAEFDEAQMDIDENVFDPRDLMSAEEIAEMLAAPLPDDEDDSYLDEPIPGVDEFMVSERPIKSPYVGGPRILSSELEKSKYYPIYRPILMDESGREWIQVGPAKRKLPFQFALDVSQKRDQLTKLTTDIAPPRAQSRKAIEARVLPVPAGKDSQDYPDDTRRPLFHVKNGKEAQLLIVRWLKLNVQSLRAIYAKMNWTYDEVDMFSEDLQQMIVRIDQIKEIIFPENREPRWRSGIIFTRWREELVAMVDVAYEHNHLRQFIDEIGVLALNHPSARLVKQLAQKLVRPLLPSMIKQAAPVEAKVRESDVPALTSSAIDVRTVPPTRKYVRRLH